MLERLREIERRFEELERLVVDPAVIANHREFAKLGRERAQLGEIVATFRQREEVARDLEEHRELTADADPEIREMARAEVPGLMEMPARISGWRAQASNTKSLEMRESVPASFKRPLAS